MFRKALAVAALTIAATMTTGAIRAQSPPNQPVKEIVFTGHETAPGLGKLAFRVMANGRVIMTDALGTDTGTWSVKGSMIRLAFADGELVYLGVIQGNQITGRATDGQDSWSWSVQVLRTPPAPRPPEQQ